MEIGQQPFTSRSERPAPAVGDRVRVYRNLPLFKHRVFSIMAMDGPYKGLILGYSRAVCLERVSFKVSERTRLRVLRDNCRTVHAFAEGYVKALECELPDHCRSPGNLKLTYNPFLHGYFYDRERPEEPVWNAAEVWTWGADLVVPAATVT